MRAHWALLLLLCALLVAANSTPSSALPQCALSCPALQRASNNCAAGGPSAWLSCFCQTPLLSSLTTSDQCSSCSAASDQNLIAAWYDKYCEDPESTMIMAMKRADPGQGQSWYELSPVAIATAS